MSGDAAVVSARAVTKRYGSFAAVDGVDFEVRKGECVGFLGPNGAGKTTIVRMVSCFSPITEGRIRVFGLDVSRSPREVKAQLGICPQEDNLDPDFSVERNLLVYARYFSLPARAVRERARELLDLMQLREKAGAKIQELSGGMKRRLVLARALLNQPRMLILDEPTTGLDPQARQLIWQRVRMLKARGTTILLTTHYMEEASQLCDRVLLMDRGEILLNGSPSNLIEREVGREVVELWNFTDEVLAFIREKGWEHETLDERVHVFLPPGDDGGREIGHRFPHQEHLLRLATLEDVFLRKAGRALRDG
ncbi:MAG: ATP-binding cassette domain-containing protein [Candidatus Eisenbacteria bacterium]|nr:ATP-binding cassette domain-containing protein [Candidatus Latescibacterota bacterium]MBD3300957.1 ATP-binding cassette domain-containing protein [Candidatus Eisenbacteria bacterium]